MTNQTPAPETPIILPGLPQSEQYLTQQEVHSIIEARDGNKKGLPVKALRILDSKGEVFEIPSSRIAKDGVYFDAQAQKVTVEFLAHGVEVVTPLTLRREAAERAHAE